MIRKLRKFARNDAGSATVELALVTPILATLLIGVVDLTMAYNRKLELEQAVQRSIERVMQTTADTTVEQNIKDEVVAAVSGVAVGDVTVTYTLTCNGTDTDPNLDCPTGQDEVRYVNVVVTDQFTPMFPLAKLGLAGDYFTINVETGVRTS